MISNWNVLSYVANRYGKLETIFNESAGKLSLVREGLASITSLETDENRLKNRIARESQPVPMALERINGIANFQDKYVLDVLSAKAKAVCRILYRGNPIGTGFLIAPDVVITNHHVIERAEDAADTIAEFDYELDSSQVPKKSACFKMNPKKFFLTSSLEADKDTPDSGLDFTMAGLDPVGPNGEQLSNYTPVFLDGNLGKIIKGESCVIIQHPNGLPKKIVLKDIAFFSETATRLVYESDTLPGSSGSMVVALGTCEVIALHHSGLPKTNEQNQILTKHGTIAQSGTPDDEIDWIGNEGIKISRIIQALQEAKLPADMENARTILLSKTVNMADQLTQSTITDQEIADVTAKNITQNVADTTTMNTKPAVQKNAVQEPSKKDIAMPSATTSKTDFLITAANKPDTIARIESTLRIKYSDPSLSIALAMPGSADPDAIELFSFSARVAGNVNEEAQELIKIPDILNAEVDTELLLNADTDHQQKIVSTESGFAIDDGLGVWDEAEFLQDYKDSKYVDAGKLEQCRQWNWTATNFDTALKDIAALPSPVEQGIRIVQFDTGYTDHSKVEGGFDLDNDINFLTNTTDAKDPRTVAFGKQPGHGTRTGSLLIGNRSELPCTTSQHNGNRGLLSDFHYRLVPYRIAETVILINRQKQLAAALDSAISQGFDIITMSMGLPPTIANAKMAKKAYDKGVIWCCAAGNEVQAVVAPAVYPGTIAIAASNPLDKDWTGSSRGDTVDITAPGQDIYVPIWNGQRNEDYAYGNGTSYATPHVAAAAALWLAKYKDQVSSADYSGWKRVEVFRDALKRSARTKTNLPSEGFGSGILDVNKLLNTKPKAANQLVYAYDKWNQNAFFASLQGYGELFKTYWNKIHSWLFGMPRNATESLGYETSERSATAQLIESTLFTSASGSRFESAPTENVNNLLDRYQTLHSLLEQSAK